MIIKRRLWIKTGIKIFMCLLISLMYLDGGQYPQCMCIFPDEILDLRCSFSLYQIRVKKGILSEESNGQRIIPYVKNQKFFILNVFKIRNDSMNEYSISQGFEKRLFSLKHYDCWDYISSFYAFLRHFNPFFPFSSMNPFYGKSFIPKFLWYFLIFKIKRVKR